MISSTLYLQILELQARALGAEKRAETAERERDEARKEIEALVWNLAGCGTIAESGRPQKFNRDMARPALASVNDMAAKLQTAERNLAALRQEVAERKRKDDCVPHVIKRMPLTLKFNGSDSLVINEPLSEGDGAFKDGAQAGWTAAVSTLDDARDELAALRAAVRYLDDRGAIDVQDETVWVRDGDDMQPAPPEHADALRRATT